MKTNSRLANNPLTSLIKRTLPSEDSGEDTNIKIINLRSIKLNPNQPRKTFTTKEMEELKASIKKDGLIQCIAVTPIENSDKFLLVAGERRVRACVDLGMEEIPAMITKGDPAEIALIENIQRQNLSPFEEAEAYAKIIEKNKYNNQELATAIGKDRAAISKMVKLNNLPERVKNECIVSNITQKDMLFRISNLDNEEEMLEIIKTIKNEGLKVKEVRELLTKRRGAKDTPKQGKIKEAPLNKNVSMIMKVLEYPGGLTNEDKGELRRLYKKIEELMILERN